jgi:CDGSH-type Zn-finger protein
MSSSSDPPAAVRITLVKDGPLRIRGHVEVRDHRNRLIKESDGLMLLCRCGGSATKPFCDGTHGRIGFCDDSAGRAAGGEGPAPPPATARAGVSS